MDDYLQRMRFFKGFFTSAADWQAEQAYHIDKLKLHNRGLHTPGILRGVGDGDSWPVEFHIDVHGLALTIGPGAALDGEGREIFLAKARKLEPIDLAQFKPPTTVYVAICYDERFAKKQSIVGLSPGEKSDNQDGAEWTRTVEEPQIVFVSQEPDNLKWIELARIKLRDPVRMIELPAKKDRPVANEIDTTERVYAGAIATFPPRLQRSQRLRLTDTMRATRRNFSDLALQFPTPSVSDVRHAAVTVELLTRADDLRPEQVFSVFELIHDAERDVYEEIARTYPALVTQTQYEDYKNAVDNLHGALQGTIDDLLHAQETVAKAASDLAQAVLPVHRPVAMTNTQLSVTTSGNVATVSLDAANSFAFGGRRVAVYQWKLVSSSGVPVADAGPDQNVQTTGSNATVILDGSKSRAVFGRRIQLFRWSKQDGGAAGTPAVKPPTGGASPSPGSARPATGYKVTKLDAKQTSPDDAGDT